jgi:polysaccharide chain length determinant protein (PEP-CTERM system associated)
MSALFESTSDTLAYIAQVAWRRRFLAFIPLLLLPPLAVVTAMVAPKRYEARMTMLVQEPSKLNPILKDISINPNLKERMSALVALAHSEVVLGKVLEDLGRIGPTTDPRDRDYMVRALSLAVNIQLVGSDIIEMRLRSGDPLSPAATLTAIANRFVERLVSPERTAVQDSERFLKQQMDERRATLDQAEQAFTAFRSANADKLPALYNATVQRLAGLIQQLEEKQMALGSADAALQDLRKRLASTNPLIGRIEESIVQVSAELASLRARYTDAHSEVQAAERKLARLEEERQHLLGSAKNIETVDLDRLWNLAAGVTQPGENGQALGSAPLLVSQLQRLQEAQARRVTLAKEVEQIKEVIATLQRDIAAFGPIDRQQQKLERDVSMARDNYDALAKRYEMARVTGALGVFEAPERVKVLEDPDSPARKITPGYIVYILAGIVAGIALGAGLAGMAEFLDTRLRKPGDFARIFGVPVIARIPRIESSGEGLAA